jgi:competence protein ComEC
MLAAVARALDGDARALVASLVLGDRGDVSRTLDDAFREAGVSHVLSVSGLHLAIAAFLFYAGLTWVLLRVPAWSAGYVVRRWAAAAALPATLVYTMLTGAQVATVRSCVVAWVWLGAVVLDRRAHALQALAIASLAILIWSPLELFDPSFQLSLAAAAGTSLLAPRWSPRGSDGGVFKKAGRWLQRFCAASAAAILATAPIGAWHFAQLAPAGIVSNIVVVPLAELGVVPLGLGGCVLAMLHLPGAGVLLHLAGWLAQAMAAFTLAFARLMPAWRVAAPTVLEIVAWYVALIAIAARGRRGLGVTLVAALVFAGSLVAHAVERRLGQTLTATFLDVGQGDACVVELPHGKVLVVDGGGSFDPSFDPGQQIVAPFLWRRGIHRIDVLVLSHPHPDHANGLPFLAEHFAIGEIWTNGQETAQPGTLGLLAAARRRHIPLGPPRLLELGGARLRPLAPLDSAGALAVDVAQSENDNSLVVELSWRGRRLLFAGDLEHYGEALLLARAGPELHADVLKVPHHGSKTSSSPPLLAALQPSIAVISVGEHNRWGFPHAAVLQRYRALGVQVLRTDRDGAVAVTVDARGRLDAQVTRSPSAYH